MGFLSLTFLPLMRYRIPSNLILIGSRLLGTKIKRGPSPIRLLAAGVRDRG